MHAFQVFLVDDLYQIYSDMTLCYGLSLVTPWQVGEAVPLEFLRIIVRYVRTDTYKIYDDLRCTRAVLLSIDSYWLCANISITLDYNEILSEEVNLTPPMTCCLLVLVSFLRTTTILLCR